MKKIIYLFVLSVLFSCNNNPSKEKIANNKVIEGLKINMLEEGYTFYSDFNIFTLEGYNRLDTSDLCYPFYAIRIDSEFVDIDNYAKSPIKYTTYTRYKKVKDYFISTKILKDEEYITLYHREISLCYFDKKIIYFYEIYYDYEQLLHIEFIYPDGRKNRYANTNENYYHYNDTVNEENISVLYPSFVK